MRWLSLLLMGISMPVLAFQAIGIQGLLSFIVYLVIVALIFWCIWWFVGYCGIPEPFNKIIRVVIGLCALIIVINLLLGMLGTPLFRLG